MVEEINLDESRKKQLKTVLKTDPTVRTEDEIKEIVFTLILLL